MLPLLGLTMGYEWSDPYDPPNLMTNKITFCSKIRDDSDLNLGIKQKVDQRINHKFNHVNRCQIDANRCQT